MSPFSNSTILELVSKYRTVATMNYSTALLGWDLEINMPEAGAEARGKAMADLELLRQKMTLDLEELVEKAGKQKTLNDAEKGV
ncbi:MAG TPA: carboxypeptidase M32, partial [Candidatus Bathyarchaeia archaeon]|nr:carboxypeptidase M32 [Candidatus Bathyarchaeia archaeon]